MPFQYILANLMSKSPHALGVLFLDDSGETIDLSCTDFSPADMKVLGAYVCIHLRQIRKFFEAENLGKTELVCIESDGIHLFAHPLPEGYAVVMAQRAPSLTARSRDAVVAAGLALSQQLFQS